MTKKQVLESENSSKIQDFVKKTLLTGMGAVFMTEESIKKAFSDLKMPKNMAAAVVNQADRTKKEVTALIAKEVRGFLDRIAVEDIIKKALAGQALEIKATIKFVDHKEQKKAVKMTAKIKKDEA